MTQKFLPLLDYVIEVHMRNLGNQRHIFEESQNILEEHILNLQKNLRFEAAIISDNERKLRLLEKLIMNQRE